VGSKATYKTAIDEAQAILDKSDATQKEVNDALSALNTATETFEAGKVAVDKTALQDAVTTATALHNGATEGTSEGNYAVGSKATYKTAIDEAQAILDKTGATQKEIDDALSALNTATDTFKAGKVVLNKTALQDAVTEATSLHAKATEGTAEGNYAVGSKATYKTAIDEAQAILDKTGATQKEIDDALSALNTATDTFKAGKVVLNKTALQDAVTEATSLHAGATEGTAEGNYAVGSKATYKTAIDEAQAILDKTGATQKEIDDALSALNTATDTFKAGKVVLNKTALQDAVTEATSLHAGATEGTAAGNYAVGSKATYKTAIDEAQAILDKTGATQKEIDDALSALNTATDTFKAGKVVLNKTALQDAVTEATSLHAGATEGIAAGNYAVGSKATYKTAIDEAQAILDKADATQKEIDDAVTALNTATATFEAGKVPTTIALMLSRILGFMK
ncbi:TPA: FIVAR domain-containing protein, partial [Clostridioides difficile]|nr:FIVAR domain-containing protein [Clostridioides difficile]